MRIDAFNTVSQIYKANSPKKTSSTSRSAQTDKYEMSQIGKDYQTAKTSVAATADVRTDLVNDIKSRMDAGTYNVSNSDFADKLISKFMGE